MFSNTKCVVLSCLFVSFECRLGWKTAGNGYFVYKASTNFSATGRLEIAGKFSTKPNSQINNVLVAGEDASGTLLFQYSVVQGQGKTVARQSGSLQSGLSSISGGSSGYLFSFTLIVSQSVKNGTYDHSVRSFISVDLTVKDSVKWNFDNITLYIGGYKRSIESGGNFEGCLSDFTFQGVDIINTYFQQYPSNTNPVRGSVTIGNFSNVAQTCDDAISTAAPTVSSTNVTPTTTSRAAESVASFSIFVVFAVVVFILS